MTDCIPLAGARPADAVIARHDGQAIAWGWVVRQSGAFAGRLRAHGVKRLGLWCDDGHLLLVGLLAAARAGCTVVLPPSDQPGLLHDLSAAWDVLAGDGAGMMPVLGDEGDTVAAPIGDIALEFFTSGSTAQPKRIERRLDQLQIEVAALHALWPGLGWGLHHATVPHQHIYGLVFKLLWPLMCGRGFFSRSHQYWESVQAEMRDGDVLIASPAHLSRLGGLSAMPRPALLLSAGAALSMIAADGCETLFATRPMEIFGSTETGAIAARPALLRAPWTPLPGNVVTADAHGLLMLTSPWGVGVHAGADKVDILPDGRFHLLGRADRVVKIEGKRVGVAAVEAALCALPQVADAVVIKVNAGRDQLAAAVVPSAVGRAELARLGTFRFGRRLRAGLAEWLEPMARPRLWRFVDEVPCNAMGKRTESAVAALFDAEVS